jgi:hypothetical protein
MRHGRRLLSPDNGPPDFDKLPMKVDISPLQAE